MEPLMELSRRERPSRVGFPGDQPYPVRAAREIRKRGGSLCIWLAFAGLQRVGYKRPNLSRRHDRSWMELQSDEVKLFVD
jgi:hypothetical protein